MNGNRLHHRSRESSIEEDFDATTFADVDAGIVAELLEMEGISDDDYYYSSEAADEPESYQGFVVVLLITRQGGPNPVLC